MLSLGILMKTLKHILIIVMLLLGIYSITCEQKYQKSINAKPSLELYQSPNDDCIIEKK